MNSTNRSGDAAAIAAIDASSVQMLNLQITVSIILIPVCFFGLIVNGLVVTVIAKTKSLHNKSQFVLLSHAVADAVNCFMQFSYSIQKCVFVAYGWPDTNYQWKCAGQLLMLLLGGKAPALFISAISIDRLLAISVPIYYRQMRKPVYVGCVNVICWGICIAQAPFFFYYDSVQSMRWMICRFVSFAPPAYLTFTNTWNTVVISITSCAYGFSLVIVAVRYFRAKNLNKVQKQEFRRQMDINVFKMMMVMLTVYLSCVAASNIGTTLGSAYLSPSVLTTFNPFLNLLIPVHSAFHMLIYIKMSPSFKEAVHELIRRIFKNETTVHSINN